MPLSIDFIFCFSILISCTLDHLKFFCCSMYMHIKIPIHFMMLLACRLKNVALELWQMKISSTENL